MSGDLSSAIGLPNLTLDNFELTDADSRYVLTSPRSLRACENCNVRPVELLRTPVEEFYDRYKDKDYLSRSDILEEFHLQEKVRLTKLSQAREERQRIIYVDTELEASKIPSYLDNKADFSYTKSKSPLPRKRSKSPKKVAWDCSTKGADLPLRSSLSRDRSPSGKSWQESLRSPSPARHVTSTPIKETRSTEDISIIGSPTKFIPRSRSVPRDLHRKSPSPVVRERVHSREELRTSYDRLQEAHLELTANVANLERQLKSLRLEQDREEMLKRKQASIDAMKLRKQSNTAANKARNARTRLTHARRVESGVKEHALRQLKSMESASRSHLLRETQAHVNELKAEIKQYKAERASRLIQEDRAQWEEVIRRRQSRALARADVKARRHVRDKSAKARRMRLEKERLHSVNMRKVTQSRESELLRNLDNIISKDRKADYLSSERDRIIRKCRDSSRRSCLSLRANKSFDRMSREAEMAARLESRGVGSRWR